MGPSCARRSISQARILYIGLHGCSASGSKARSRAPSRRTQAFVSGRGIPSKSAGDHVLPAWAIAAASARRPSSTARLAVRATDQFWSRSAVVSSPRKAHRPSVSQDDPRRPQVEIRGGREVRRDAADTL